MKLVLLGRGGVDKAMGCSGEELHGEQTLLMHIKFLRSKSLEEICVLKEIDGGGDL